jgi:hypothetical protein
MTLVVLGDDPTTVARASAKHQAKVAGGGLRNVIALSLA